MSGLAWQGIGLFAFIPLVLVLYLRLPLGPGPSLLLGLAVMIGHRFIALPWAARHGRARCLWCGRTVRDDPAGNETPEEPPNCVLLEISSGGRKWTLAACGPPHAGSAARFATFARRFRFVLLPGIFLPLFVLLAATALNAAGFVIVPQSAVALQFRVIVAATVVAASVGYLMVSRIDDPLVFPFPIHNLTLLGIRGTLWVFRLVGAWWLAAALLGLARPAP